MRYIKMTKIQKKAMAWSTLGKIILVLVTVLLILIVLSMFMGKSFDILGTLKGFLGG